MSKIFEALEKAKRQSREKAAEPVPPITEVPSAAPEGSSASNSHSPVSPSTLSPEAAAPQSPVPPPSDTIDTTPSPYPPDLTNGIDLEGEMITLYQTIDSTLPHISNKVILILGSRSDEGASTVARELARVSALKMGKSVLLVDLDRSRPELKYFYNIKLECDVEEIIKGKAPLENAFCQVGDESLYVSPLFQQSVLSPRALDGAKSINFWQELRKRFDLVLIDAPPATLFADGPFIARLADGVILVVEAEKTSWPIVQTVKEKIIQHGGNILGIVFNKRRYYIPQFIYKRL